MNEMISMLLILAAGILLGSIFFGGLWWSIQKGRKSKHPALWFSGSLLLRMSITLAGFYFLGHGHWERMMVCLLGFIIARFILMRLIGLPREENKNRIEQEARNAN